MIVNTANTIVWRWENSHAFGANLPDEDPDGNAQLFEYHPRFPGQYFDKETNLHYNYFKYYESETGRYISPDPIGFVGGLWGYVEQNPLNHRDPLGLNPTTVVGAGEDWTRNPNGRGSGWRDANGDVWIPRPGDAHGGPHWGVQTPGGGYINIYPGGKRR